MSAPALALWGGIECTIARLGDRSRDQVVETGHRDRAGDLDAIAAMGIRTLRYPVLWETIEPERGHTDWAWHDARLTRLRELSITPIAGLIHHGSGPLFTHLLDPDFPRLLARHAERVARRYPWIEDFTPVNEPLTTARFSALYGHWYPHQQNDASFLTALVHQCRATVLAMRAIRRVTPGARLIQTDDFGKTFATPQLAYQAEHENERRWLAFDLLCGRVDKHHPWWRILRDHGIAERALAFFQDGEGAPDIIGINHYLTSERFLDQRLGLYPPHLHGGNGREAYADVEAVRIRLPGGDLGPTARLREVWQRYERPIAVTEVHHGCTRDEQLRWLSEVWRAAETVRAEGADIRAVTLWSLFGTMDWNTLLTQTRGIYEPGAFDIRSDPPRPTALAQAGQAIATTGRFDHPVLDRAGWWRRGGRFYGAGPQLDPEEQTGPARQLLLTGAQGRLGRALSRLCRARGLDHVSSARPDLDLADATAIAAALDRHRPWAVINAAASADRSDAQERRAGWQRDHIDGPAHLAEACARRGIPLVTFSSALVFDGPPGRAWRESDPVCPDSAFGRDKAEAEKRVQAAYPGALVVRTGPLFGAGDGPLGLCGLLDTLAEGHFTQVSAEHASPTYLPDLAHVVLDLLIDGESGLWHLANPGEIAWADFVREAALRAGLDPDLVVRDGSHAGRNHGLTTERGALLPPLSSALDRFFLESGPLWTDRRIGVAAA